MSTSMWEGQRVRLRALEPSDWEVVFDWNQDDEGARRAHLVPFPQSREAVRRWAEDEATYRPQNDAFRWAIESAAGELVGTISSHSCDRRVGSFGYGLYVREQDRGQGYASEAILLLLRYFFQELRYQKVTVHVYSFNEPSLRLHEKLGFQVEGRLRRMVFTRGQHFDDIVLGMTVEEFTERYGVEPGRIFRDSGGGSTGNEQRATG